MFRLKINPPEADKGDGQIVFRTTSEAWVWWSDCCQKAEVYSSDVTAKIVPAEEGAVETDYVIWVSVTEFPWEGRLIAVPKGAHVARMELDGSEVKREV